MKRVNRVCGECKRVMPHHGRGLCGTCYTAARKADRIDDYPCAQWRRDDLLAEWVHLRRAGVNITEAASRIGISRAGLEKAIERAGKRVA